MKKFLTLVLALVMALAIALPAMAFTSDTTAPSDKAPYELDVYLVEYENDEFFGITSLPPSDRGYAKNEIVAAIVELYVPKKENPAKDGYTALEISGDDVSFNVTDAPKTSTSPAAPTLTGVGTNHADGWKFVIPSTSDVTFYNADGNKTYKWLVFAKVTGEEASITAELIDGSAPSSLELNVAKTYTLGGVNYSVTKKSGSYEIAMVSGDYAGAKIQIKVDSKNKSTGMSIASVATPGSFRPLGVTVGGALGVYVDDEIKTSGAIYESIMDVYEDVVKDVFGMDYMLIGNYVRDSFFTGLTSGDTISATVEIKPWTAYVTVPDNIVVDPPKTGDAASIVGFVMIVLAAAAVVAVKKVRA